MEKDGAPKYVWGGDAMKNQHKGERVRGTSIGKTKREKIEKIERREYTPCKMRFSKFC